MPKIGERLFDVIELMLDGYRMLTPLRERRLTVPVVSSRLAQAVRSQPMEHGLCHEAQLQPLTLSGHAGVWSSFSAASWYGESVVSLLRFSWPASAVF